ncbi:hypothetical protein [Neobacillus sp.]|nr:hypothetical protein [Neobacillus sp.]
MKITLVTEIEGETKKWSPIRTIGDRNREGNEKVETNEGYW